jgi:ATP-dependent Clp protease ATP-binding subunit ClpB
LLQILDDGRLTDGQGRVVNFKNTIVIMTSNLGGDLIAELTDKKEIEKKIQEVLKVSFRPEFLNRVDEIAIFSQLKPEDIRKIVDIQISYLQKRLEEKQITIELSDKAKEVLSKAGYDVVYGARPLKRVIQRMVQDPVAMKILAGEIKPKQKVSVDVRKGKEDLTFEVK